jgi:hypothetical protein
MNTTPTTDDADLPDHDYESIYGHDAMYTRFLARLAALGREMGADVTGWQTWTAQRDATHSTYCTDGTHCTEPPEEE